MPSLVSDRTRARIMRLLNHLDTSEGRTRGSGGNRWAVVVCDDDTPIGVGSGNVKEQLYPATIIFCSADGTYPPLETPLNIELTGAPVLLTVLGEDSGDSPVSVAPHIGFVYAGPLLGNVEVDKVGSLEGRLRVISPDYYATPAGSGGIGGSGTDNHVMRFDGTTDAQDSFTQISDTGVVSVYDTLIPTTSSALVQLVPDNTNSRATIGLYPNGTANQRALIRVEDNDFQLDLDNVAGARTLRVTDFPGFSNIAVWDFHSTGDVCVIRLAGSIDFGSASMGTPLAGLFTMAIVPAFGLSKFRVDPNDVTAYGQYQVVELGVTYFGATGTVGAMEVHGGLVTALPSAAGDALLSGTQTFTGANTFHPATDLVPTVFQGGGAGTANLVTGKTAGGSTVFTVGSAGAVAGLSFTGSGAPLTSLNASELASGTIPSARIGTVDGGPNW